MHLTLTANRTGASNIRAMLWRLRQFEGNRCVWRAAVGVIAAAAVPTIPIAAIVLNTYLGGHARWPIVAASGLLVAGSTLVAPWVWKRQLWRIPLSTRLAMYESTDRLPWAVRIFIKPEDHPVAAAALRRAKFNPHSYLQLGSPPDDASELSLQVTVIRPTAWHPAVSDEQELEEVADALRHSNLRARVGGLDVFHSGSELGPGIIKVRERGRENAAHTPRK